MIARPYLRTPKSVIVQTSALARRKRHEFVRAVAQGLIPPETPPMQRKKRKRYLDVSVDSLSIIFPIKKSFQIITPSQLYHIALNLILE